MSRDAALFARFDRTSPAAILLGREVTAIDHETSSVRVSFKARPEFANRNGIVQGGFLSAMLDSACAVALLVQLDEGLTLVTKSIEINFVSPAPLGDLLATARVVARGERDAQVEAELKTPDGVVVANAKAKLRIRRV
jgi:uncharacterized protein (TIGR00369 family)